MGISDNFEDVYWYVYISISVWKDILFANWSWALGTLGFDEVEP